jgi:LmbE family N-acetylglucosaminyl deacetylase
MRKTVMVLTAHPDDAEMFAGGTIAKMAEAGDRVVIVIATDGRKGSFEHDSDSLARLRSQEARRAAAVLGAEPPILLGHRDMEIDRASPGALREQLVRLIRSHRPDVSISEDALYARDLHPDHRGVALAAAEAIAFASLPLLHPEHLADGLEVHSVAEKYYFAAGPAANKFVDITATMDKKIAALAEHHTQIVSLVESMRRQVTGAGVDWRQVIGDIADDPQAIMALRLRTMNAEVGQAAGVEYAEAFRYERFSAAIERLLVRMNREPAPRGSSA